MTWGKVTQTLTGLSFELLVIALIQGVFVSRDKSYTVELLQTTAFIFLLVATFLAVLMYFGKLKDSKPTMITTIVFCFLSAIFMISGLFVWSIEDSKSFSIQPVYALVFLSAAILFCILAGIAGILDSCRREE